MSEVRELVGDSAPVTSSRVLLEANGVAKSYGRTPALRGIDVSVVPGEVLAIMGPSGSGKSTLLHCLAGVIAPDEGTVTYDGTVISDLSEAERSRLRLTEFGFVFQFGQLLPELTAADNVTIPLLLSGVKRTKALRTAEEWLDRLGLADVRGQLAGELSGGQAQRVAIARALATKPKLVFADEPTGALDSLSAENVMTLLLQLVRETGTTVVLITHDTRTAAFADREVIVRDGLTSNGERKPVR